MLPGCGSALRYSPNIVAMGCEHAFAVTKSGLFSWGNNANGQLGLGHLSAQPTPIFHPLQDVISIHCSNSSTFAITKQGNLYVWGANDFGQLGLGNTTPHLTPQKSPLKNVLSLSIGTYQTYARTTKGWYCWGKNDYGQLGLGHVDPQLTPIKFPLKDIISISCGGGISFALTKNGLYSWGYNPHGQLGLGHFVDQHSPQRVQLEDVLWVNCGGYHTIAGTKDGIFSWGANDCGQLGLGHKENVSNPTKLNLQNRTLGEVVYALCGATNSVGVTSTGGIIVWGASPAGENSDLRGVSQLTPTRISVERHAIPFVHCFNTSIMLLTKEGLFSLCKNEEAPEQIPLDLCAPSPNFRLSLCEHDDSDSPFQASGVKAHKAVLMVRCPGFFQRQCEEVSKQAMKAFVEFIYTNDIEAIPTISVLCELWNLAKDVNLEELSCLCNSLIVESIDTNNAFDVLRTGLHFGLTTEDLEWVIWFIGTSMTESQAHSMGFASDLNELGSVAALIWPSPPQTQPFIPTFRPKPIEDDLDALFSSGIGADFELKFRGDTFQLHSFILSRWDFFHVIKHSNEHDPQVELPTSTFSFLLFLREYHSLPAKSLTPLQIGPSLTLPHLRKILRFVYCNKLDDITMKDAVWILRMKEYYIFDSSSPLIVYCEGLTTVGESNWVSAYQVGLELKESLLTEKAKSFGEKKGGKSAQDIIFLVDQVLHLQSRTEEKDKEIEFLRLENQQLHEKVNSTEKGPKGFVEDVNNTKKSCYV